MTGRLLVSIWQKVAATPEQFGIYNNFISLRQKYS